MGEDSEIASLAVRGVADRVKARMRAREQVKKVSWRNKLTRERILLSSDEEESSGGQQCKPKQSP